MTVSSPKRLILFKRRYLLKGLKSVQAANRIGMTTEYKPEHILGSLMELRGYGKLTLWTQRYLEEEGWTFILKALERCRKSEAIVPAWDIHLREGILRDGMIDLLELEGFESLDVDFLKEFSEIQGNDLESLRVSARERALELLEAQVKRGNTFFMDVEEWKENELAIYVPDIIGSRIREVERLGPKPHLYEVYSTYYGYSMLTTEVDVEQAGVPEIVRYDLLGILQEVGGVSELSGKQLKFSTLAFSKCSPHQTALLWNMLRFARGGMKYKYKALQKLGKLGDSRALDLIHLYMGSREGSRDRLFEECILCLGRIGHPDSYPIAKDGGGPAGGIRSYKISNDIERYIEHYSVKLGDRPRVFHLPQKGTIGLIQMVANTRLRMWMYFYDLVRNDKALFRNPKVQSLLAWAESNVHPPYDEL